MPRKLYRGRRTEQGGVVEIVERGTARPLPLRFGFGRDQVPHSSTGFEWGYGGSGPAQLAFALAVDVLGDAEAAKAVYQDFKREVIASLGREWSLAESTLRQHLEAVLEAAAHSTEV